MAGKLQELMTNEAIAQNGTPTKSLIATEVNLIHFQADTAVAASDLPDVTVRIYTNDRVLVDDIPFSTLAQIWHHNQGSTGDDTDTMCAVDLGAIYLDDKEELSVQIANANAETVTMDVYAECGLGLAPKMVKYQKRQDGNFTCDGVDEIWLTGTALDESSTIINVNDRSTPIKAFWLKHTNHSATTEDKTIVKVVDNDIPSPVTINTSYALTTYYFLVISTVFDETKSAKQTAKAIAQVKKQLRELPSTSIRSAIHSGQLPANVRNIGGIN